MLDPERFQQIPDPVSRNINELQNFAIRKIAESIRKNNELTGTAQNLYDALERTRIFDIDFRAELAVMTERTLSDIDDIFAGTVSEMHETDKPTYKLVDKPFVEYSRNPYLQQLTRAMSDQTKQTFENLTQTRSIGFVDKSGKFVGAKDYLQSRLQSVEFLVVNGVQSYDEAIKGVVSELVNSGLRYADYESGHRDTVEVFARRAVLTGITQLSGRVSVHNLIQLGGRHAQTSYHVGARTAGGWGDVKDHLAWSGKVFHLSDEFFIENADGQIPPPYTGKEYPDFLTYVGKPESGGIGTWNCRHSWSVILIDYQEPFYTPEKLEEMKAEDKIKRSFTYKNKRGKEVTKELDIYDQTQFLRDLERDMRAIRARAAGLKSGGNMDGYHAEKAMYQRQKALYERFLREMNYEVDGVTPLNKSGFTHTNQLQSRVWIDQLGRI